MARCSKIDSHNESSTSTYSVTSCRTVSALCSRWDHCRCSGWYGRGWIAARGVAARLDAPGAEGASQKANHGHRSVRYCLCLHHCVMQSSMTVCMMRCPRHYPPSAYDCLHAAWTAQTFIPARSLIPYTTRLQSSTFPLFLACSHKVVVEIVPGNVEERTVLEYFLSLSAKLF